MGQHELLVVFPLYPGVLQMDFTAPHEVFARMPHARLVLASARSGTIEADSGIVIGDVTPLAQIPRCDILCVPGGPGVDAAMRDDLFLAEIRRLAASARYLVSVCTGAMALGAAGLLQGKRATTHWASHDLLPLFGAHPVHERVVRDGNLFTSAGVTAGIDLALAVVAEAAGEEVAQVAQLLMEYDPQPPFRSGSPATASQAVLDRVKAMQRPGLVARRATAEMATRRLQGT